VNLAGLWWGPWLITITSWSAVATVLSPLPMTCFWGTLSAPGAPIMYLAGRLRLRPISATDNDFRFASTHTDPPMLTLAAEPIGCRLMTGAPRLSSDLDALLPRVARRDAEAFAAFYDRTKARVYGLAIRVLRDPGYSEETTQEVYLEVWRTAVDYDRAKGSALSWLMTMAHRRAVDRVRSEQAAGARESRYGAATVEQASDVVVDSAIAADERRRIAGCLDRLTDAQRQCIEMAYYGGLTYAEVSQRLSVNLSTIKSRMRDALRGLRNCLGVL
jgi:RNA polymerase sigma-70 factor, ECF subfamily